MGLIADTVIVQNHCRAQGETAGNPLPVEGLAVVEHDESQETGQGAAILMQLVKFLWLPAFCYLRPNTTVRGMGVRALTCSLSGVQVPAKRLAALSFSISVFPWLPIMEPSLHPHSAVLSGLASLCSALG